MSKYVIQILEDNVDRPDSINDWLDEVTSLPPVQGYKPGMGTAAVRRIRDAIDRAQASLIVLDASAAVELLVARSRAATSVAAVLRNELPRVPVHFDAEVFAAIRGLTRRREIVLDDGLAALFRLRTLRLQRVAIVPLVAEAFALRDRFAAYESSMRSLRA